MNASSFPALVQRFFTDRLIGQQGASPHTVAGYRDTFRLLLQFAAARLGRAPSALRLEELDVGARGGARHGRPRHCRILTVAVGGRITARIFNLPPQCPH